MSKSKSVCGGFGNHREISHTIANKADAVMTEKATMEPNKSTVSFKNLSVVIVGSFIALYTVAIAADRGNNHSMACGFAWICSGDIKVANTKMYIADILFPRSYFAEMGQRDYINNTQEVKQS